MVGGQLGIDDFPKNRKGLRPAHEDAVDKKARSPADSRPGALLTVLLDRGLIPAAVQTNLELLPIQRQHCSMLLQELAAQLIGVFKKHVVVFPKLALLQGTAGSFGRQFRLGMDLTQWKIAVCKPNLFRILL